MWRRLRKRRGQSIVEYLVIAAVIVAAILAVRGTVQANMKSLYDKSAQKTAEAATALGNLKVE